MPRFILVFGCQSRWAAHFVTDCSVSLNEKTDSCIILNTLSLHRPLLDLIYCKLAEQTQIWVRYWTFFPFAQNQNWDKCTINLCIDCNNTINDVTGSWSTPVHPNQVQTLNHWGWAKTQTHRKNLFCCWASREPSTQLSSLKCPH